MVSFSHILRPASLRAAITCYALVTACRYLWALLTNGIVSGPAYLHPFDTAPINALSYMLSHLYMPLGGLLTFALWVAQAVLLWRLVRLIGNGDEAKSERPQPESWLATPILLGFIVLLTCSIIGWIVQTGASPRHFFGYLAYGSSVPVQVGLVLSLLGFAFGGRFVAGAKAAVGGLFGVNYLPKDHPLSQRVARHAGTLGISHAPALGTVNVMNAFAVGTPKDSAVILGQPLMDLLTEDELDAVIGHELGHVYHNDMNRMQFAEGFQRMLGSVISATTAILVSALSRNRSDVMLGRAVGSSLRQTVFVGSELVVKRISRTREFHADAIGARIASPAAMIGALERLHGIPAQPTKLETQYGYLMFRGSRFGAWFSTHPHLEKRIKALRTIEARQGGDEAIENNLVPHSQLDALAVTAAAALGSAKTGLAAASTSLDLPERGRSAWAKVVRLIAKRPSWHVGLRSTILTGATLAALFFIAPAIWSYYGLGEKAESLRTSAFRTYDSISASLADVSERAIASLTSYGQPFDKDQTSPQASQTEADGITGEIARLRRELLEVKFDRNRLRNEVAKLREEAIIPTTNTSDLQRQLEQQRASITALQKQLAQQSRTVSQPPSGDVEKLLGERNVQLSDKVDEQRGTIVGLRQDIETLRFKIQQQEAQLSGAAAENTSDTDTDTAASWLAAAVDRQGDVDTATLLQSREDAERLALRKCGGATAGCKLIGAWRNGCFALSRPAGQKVRQNWWFAADNGAQAAERRASRQCRQESGAPRCDIRISVCSPAHLSKI